MTPYEQKLLDDFLTRLRGAGESVKDPQAEALICERLAGHPDAAYLLVQRALLLEQALASAQTQIAKLQQAAAGHDAGAGSGSFLGQAAWGTQQTAPPPVAPPPPPAAPPSWRERLFGSTPAPVQQAAPSAASSFLGTAASTAAGVAGGMFLFQGLEHMFGGHQGQSGGLFGNADNTPQQTIVENVVTNNYYDTGTGTSISDAGGFADDTDLFDNDNDTWV
ncbi:DUF2076 domain-containing protein [Xylella fastidiosa]|uniref:DUF2076 domain-containing protein n=1 Tax=Xylella fastidiosa TaxID=2371 RepID=UPI0003D3B084|nr:DUF2076 domain-containing protein [Xylella fastidiosa]ALR04982.1 DUF2076 domain-containing protein [Xylella fastidiosa]ARO69368.1 ABC transporter substrate-binding protein [Xylella fastidiosa subsp. pauca]AVI21395.1 ABC transporter substrate-binding protein [Xylella fastidiosa]AVI23430.1 ABC transporter substrate-binding protein [Xylella fastidiosa]KIA58694.1 ABC transporter substrate-binding protein [Xylella fastidiosa]